MTRLSVAFAGLGIVMATIGLYAAIAHSVSQLYSGDGGWAWTAAAPLSPE